MALLATVSRSLWGFWLYYVSHASPERVQRLQQRRLRSLLRHATSRSNFYRDKLAKIDIDRCAISDLPTTTKDELMERFDEVVTDPSIRRVELERFVDDPSNIGKLFRDKFLVCHTSGSQGRPLIVVQDPLMLNLLFAFQMTRGNVEFARLGPLEAARRFFRPARIAILISKPGFFPSAWAWKHLPASLAPYARLLYVQANDDSLIEKLNDFRPTTLVSTPTTLDLLALKAEQLRLDQLIQVVANSETMTRNVRARLAEAYKVPVLDNYGSGECLFLTNGCHTDPGVHVNADWAILEVVDEQNKPVPAGEFGHKVLLTNLANTTQPIIRYEIRDRVMMATSRCNCGNKLPRIEQILGRTADVFWMESPTGTRPLTTFPFQHALEHFRQLREWQATQLNATRIRLSLEPLPNASLDLQAIRERLNQRLQLAGWQQPPEIEFDIVPRLLADPQTGKFRRMVCLPSPTQHVPIENVNNKGCASELNHQQVKNLTATYQATK